MFWKPLEAAEKGLKQGDDPTRRQTSNNLLYTSRALYTSRGNMYRNTLLFCPKKDLVFEPHALKNTA